MYQIVKLKLKSNTTQDELERLVQFAMRECDCSGLEEFSLEESEVDDLLGERAYSGGDLPISLLDEVDSLSERDFKFFFENNTSPVQKFLNHLTNLNIEFSVEEREASDWDAEWKKTYSPVEIDSGLWIVPEWMRSDFNPSISVFINPGQGFGTGKHETTFMCLQLMRKIPLAQLRCVLDLGCGSGILGIALLKFSQAALDFCDIDKNALDNTLQNLTLNFEDRDLSSCALVLRERLKIVSEKYELIFANILLSALEEEYETVVTSLETGGYLIASGLLNHQVNEFIRHYEGFEIIEIATIKDWSALLLRKL